MNSKLEECINILKYGLQHKSDCYDFVDILVDILADIKWWLDIIEAFELRIENENN
jgi:hypothetical protein